MQALPTDSDARPTRRQFLHALGLGALAVHADPADALGLSAPPPQPLAAAADGGTMLGAYGDWAAGLALDPPLLSLRRGGWDRIDDWRAEARARLLMRTAPPEVASPPVAETVRQRERDGLHVERVRWAMPYGPPVEGVLLKPAGATGPLSGVLALHDHGGDKWHGWRKVADADGRASPMIQEHWGRLYGGRPVGERARSPGLRRPRVRRVRLREPPRPAGGRAGADSGRPPAPPAPDA